MACKLQTALRLAEQGFYLFPLGSNSKIPRKGFHWREESTRNPKTIKSWYKEGEPSPNIGSDCGKSGHYVIDVDLKNGKHGDKTLANLEKSHGFTPTLEITTPSGGKHLIYRDSYLLSNTAEALGPGIDTRGVGGFIVVEGSSIDGNAYRATAKRKIADLDPWVAKALSAHRYKERGKKGKSLREDDPADIARSKKWLQDAADHAIEGEGGDHATYAVAARLKEFGCSQDSALELMLDHWNDDCDPPWDADDLARKVENAYTYGQMATGAMSPEAEFGDDPLPEKLKELQKRFEQSEELFQFLNPFDVDALPLREWLYDNLLLAQNVTILGAPPGSGKSTFTLSVALAKALGHGFFGFNPHGRGRVWIYNNEDALMEMKRRIGAIMRMFNLPMSDLMDDDIENPQSMLGLSSGERRPLRIAKRGEGGAIVAEDVKQLIKDIKKNNVKLLIVDPLSETHPAAENSNEEMLEIAKLYRYVAWATGCAVLLVHHSKKLDMASSDGHEGNMDTLRGASSILGVARIVLTLFNMSKQRAQEFGVGEDERWRYTGLNIAKANMTAATNQTFWFEKKAQAVGVSDTNLVGEDVGVLVPVKLARDRMAKMKDAMRDLLYDIEAECEGNTLAVAEIARRLCVSSVMHGGKKPRSIEKAILRLFDYGELHFTGKTHQLTMIEKKSPKQNGPRKLSMIRAISLASRTTVEEQEFM